MSNVIQFPGIDQREADLFERELDKFSGTRTSEETVVKIVDLALNAKTIVVRERAALWMLEIMNVRIVSA